MRNDFESHVDYIANLIKLVASADAKRICKVAIKLNTLFDEDEIYELDNHVLYNSYCEVQA